MLRPSLHGLLALAGALPLSVAQAQTPPTAGQLLRDVQPAQRPVIRDDDAALPQGGASRPAMTAPGGSKVRLKAVRITGAQTQSLQRLQALLADAVGQELDFSGLQGLAERITAHYRAQGYAVARAWLPATDDRAIDQHRDCRDAIGMTSVARGIAVCLRFGVLALLAPCIGILGVTPTFAARWTTFPVDDSMSHVQAPSAQLRWRDALPSKQSANLLDATTEVRIVLNVSPWISKPARIYMVMPQLPQSTLTVQWTTAGALLPGRLSGGQRQLVFQGVIAGARLEDTMRIVASTDARDAVTPARVNFTFEIEVPSR